MAKTEWFLKNDKLKFEFVKNNILHNNYYEFINKEYKKANKEDKKQLINTILKCFDDIFNGYFSIYTIMDSVESYLREYKKLKFSVADVIEQEDFEIKDY